MLYAWEDLPRDTIAEMMGMTRAAIDQRIHRCINDWHRYLRPLRNGHRSPLRSPRQVRHDTRPDRPDGPRLTPSRTRLPSNPVMRLASRDRLPSGAMVADLDPHGTNGPGVAGGSSRRLQLRRGAPDRRDGASAADRRRPHSNQAGRPEPQSDDFPISDHLARSPGVGRSGDSRRSPAEYAGDWRARRCDVVARQRGGGPRVVGVCRRARHLEPLSVRLARAAPHPRRRRARAGQDPLHRAVRPRPAASRQRTRPRLPGLRRHRGPQP